MQLEKIQFKGFSKEMVAYQSGPEFIVFFWTFLSGVERVVVFGQLRQNKEEDAGRKSRVYPRPSPPCYCGAAPSCWEGLCAVNG